MRAGFFVVVLPRKSQVYCGCGFLVNVGAPRLFSLPVGRHVGRAKVVSVQVVPLGVFVFEFSSGYVRLPDKVGAPEAVGLCIRMEAIRLGERSLLVGLGHEAVLAIDVVGGLGRLALRDGLGNSSAEGVIGVAGRAIVALVLYFALPFSSVVAVLPLPVQPLFFFGVACLGVADGDVFIHNKAISKRGEVARVAGELVVFVVLPDAVLVLAVGAVADFVIEVFFFWQAKLPVLVIWLGFGEAVQPVVGVGGCAAVACDGGDVAEVVVVVAAAGKGDAVCIGALVPWAQERIPDDAGAGAWHGDDSWREPVVGAVCDLFLCRGGDGSKLPS